MLRISAEAGRRLRYCVFGLAAVSAALAVTVDSADARRSRRPRPGYSPPFASIIVDANSGSTLQATNADSLRHPASLTKIMTLYLLFERLESGKMKLDDEMDVSEHASDQAPTKLGLRPGQTLRVEDAIKGLVTKSANDAAVVIGEAIAGDEDEFAKMMTRKARSLGMSKTVYRNASGLPDGEQVTTARDQAQLGRAIQDRFPKYYRYFSTAAFHYRGRVIRNHNKLLGRVEGVDGIKTGYTRSSGFNLVTSLRRGNRRLVGVVLGGSSGGARDATMRELLAEHIGSGAVRRTAPIVAEREGGEMKVAAAETREAPRPAAAPVQATAKSAELSSGVIAAPPLSIMPGSAEPMVPVRVKTVHVKSGHGRMATAPAQAAAAPAATASVAAAGTAPAVKAEPAVLRAEPARANPPLQPNHGIGTGILGTLPANSTNGAMAMAAEPWQRPAPGQPAAFPAPIPTASASAPAPAAASTPAAIPTVAAAAAKPVARSGWIIQVGAFPDEAEARQRLDAARGQAKRLLGKADPFTETVAKGDKTLYRARFAGLDRDQAEAACRTLKRNDISCITIKN